MRASLVMLPVSHSQPGCLCEGASAARVLTTAAERTSRVHVLSLSVCDERSETCTCDTRTHERKGEGDKRKRRRSSSRRRMAGKL